MAKVTKLLRLQQAWEHVRRRAVERWGWEIERDEWMRMGEQIEARHERAEGVRFVERKTHQKVVYVLRFEGRTVPVLWNEDLRAVQTVLPAEAVAVEMEREDG